MLVGEGVVEVREQLGELLREVVRRSIPAIALKRVRGQRVGPRRAADAEIDPALVQSREDRERLGHLERAVVREHHAAAPDADPLRRGRERPDQRLRARAREGQPVVLGHPVAVVAEPVGVAGEVERVVQGVGARRPFGHRRLVENREKHRVRV